MIKSNSFKDYILEQMREISGVRARGMFDSFGLYLEDKFFGIIHDSSLYFKTDIISREKYINLGMEPFRPSEKQILKNYLEVPPQIIEEPEKLKKWVFEATNLE